MMMTVMIMVAVMAAMTCVSAVSSLLRSSHGS
jgi:hypothetical protein